MNKCKKMLQLRGFSNLPTIKHLELKSNNSIIKSFDDFSITSVNKALEKMQKREKFKYCKFDFTTTYINLIDNSIFRINTWEKSGKYDNVKTVLEAKKHYLSINNQEYVNMVSGLDEEKNLKYTPCKMTTTCKVSLKIV